MKQEYEVISVNVTDPAGSIFKDFRNDKSECIVIKCSNKDNCDLYARGECVVKTFLGGGCPYGKKSTEVGFTRKARGYSKWRTDKEKQFEGIGNKLASASNVMGVIGDYIYLPYHHINMNERLPFLSKAGFMSNGKPFLPIAAFTIENIIAMFNFAPQALMGGTITSYQKEELPKLAQHISEQFPEKWAELLSVAPILSQYWDKYTYVGRKAYIWSLRDGVTFVVGKETWLWDGEYLTSTTAYASTPHFGFKAETREIRIKPVSDAVIAITDNSQVDTNTQFQV